MAEPDGKVNHSALKIGDSLIWIWSNSGIRFVQVLGQPLGRL